MSVYLQWVGNVGACRVFWQNGSFRLFGRWQEMFGIGTLDRFYSSLTGEEKEEKDGGRGCERKEVGP